MVSTISTERTSAEMAGHSSQLTLASGVEVTGIGLHSGDRVTCRLHPAEVNTGRVFVRVDLADRPEIPARADATTPAQLSTLLQTPSGASVRTIEHLVAALTGLGIDNCRIELDGAEVPIMDGSARDFVEAIAAVGTKPQAEPKRICPVDRPVAVWEGDAFVSVVPAPATRYTYGIDFANSPIGEQWFSWSASPETFRTDVAPARTFTRERDAELARQHGLIKGGSLDNAIVCTEETWLTPLRFANEPVRHKLLDLLGDLSLTGVTWQGHFIAYKAGHTLHARFARELLDQLG
ncbi:MAG: UDP-3-O-acyl-N-acetylglucosamine deacetylase [Cyanobacteria bacterium J06639_1]